MLTGQAAFQGEDVTEILAAVVKGGANLDLLPANLHPRVREVITRCLQKDLKRRYPSIADVRYEIEQALADPSGVLVQPVTGSGTSDEAANDTAVGCSGCCPGCDHRRSGCLETEADSEPRQVMRFYYELPEDQQFSNLMNALLAVSPDGRQFVYSTSEGLYLRSMDELDARLIPGTGENPQQPVLLTRWQMDWLLVCSG